MLREACLVTLHCAGLLTATGRVESADSGLVKRITTQRQLRLPATDVDFASELCLGFVSLDALGARIEHTRKMADPVGLASAALELSCAEKVSGRHAPLRASELLKEAVELAKLRNRSAELLAVAILAGEEPVVDGLRERVAAAKLSEAEEAAAIAAGERSRGLSGELFVSNHSDVGVGIYVNGELVGWVAPRGQDRIRLRQPGVTVLEAIGHRRHWREELAKDYENYEWLLEDELAKQK